MGQGPATKAQDGGGAGSRTVTDPRLPFSEKLAFGLGDISNSLAAASVSFWLLIYLTDTAHINPSLAGLSLMVGRIVDALCDPVVGWLSDRTTTRWGKRRPFLLFGSFFYGLTFFAVWVVPSFESELARFAYISAALIFFNTALAFVFIPYTSLTAAITNDYNDRTALTGYRMTFGQLAFLIGAVLPSQAVQWATGDRGAAFFESLELQPLFGTWARTTHQGFFVFGVIGAIIIIMSVLVTFFGTTERHFDQSEDEHGTNPFAYVKTLVGLVRTNIPFRISLMIKLLSTCAITVVSVNLNFYLEYVLNLESHKNAIFTTLIVSGICAAPVWVQLSKRYGKAELYQVTAALYALILPSLLFLDEAHRTWITYIAIIAGALQSAALIIPWSIIPDVVEFDEYQNGKRREGLLYGGTSFAYKLATGIAVFLAGVALSVFGYAPGQVQTDTAKLGIRLVIGIVPAALFLMSIYYARRYPLTAERHREIVKKLAERNMPGATHQT